MAEKEAQLLVTLVGARGLPPAKSGSWFKGTETANPYCSVQVVGKPDSKFQTMAVDGTQEPTWNRQDFVEGYAPGDPLHFEVRHQDSASKGVGQVLGQVTLASSMFQPNGYEGELALAGGKDAVLIIKIEPNPGEEKKPAAGEKCLFDKVDRNGDGKITQDEWARAVADGVLPRELPPELPK
mmetsp:Transcript_18721/g.58836  ORF Transcript_18721/g.58836 Transcript_18721/m.58836 type:complete len:182 (+) Transcript_18721:153-698(+)